MTKTRIPALLLAGALVFSLAACGSSETAEETATSSESEQPSETATPSESETPEEEEPELAPDGVWETDGERVTIEDDTVTIEYVDEDGNVTETYWVGSFKLDEDSDTWTSTRDPEAEMTAGCDIIEFKWEGTDNRYDTLSYAVTNEDGTQTTVRLERTESIGEVAEGVVPDFSGSEDETSETSAGTSPSATAADISTSVNESAGDTAAASSGVSGSQAAEKTSSGGTNESTSNNTSSGSGTSASNNSTGNTGSVSSGAGSNASAGGSGSSGTTAAACSHNYQSSVKTAATCSSTGTMKYTCTKCGDSYETTIPATGNHNWQAIYKTVHHDATGHYETVTVQEAVYEYRDVCNKCGYVASTTGSAGAEEVFRHIRREHDDGASYSNKLVCIQEAVTEQQWVVDTAAYDEQAVDYYRCTNCGAVK